jgi:hypothetical protein
LQANQGHGKCASQGMQPMSHIHTPMSTKKWKSEPTHSQVDSHFGNWNTDGFPNFWIMV